MVNSIIIFINSNGTEVKSLWVSETSEPGDFKLVADLYAEIQRRIDAEADKIADDILNELKNNKQSQL